MPVHVDNIEIQIEKLIKKLNDESWNNHWLTFGPLTIFLNKQLLIPIEYIYPIEKLIKVFEEKKVLIPLGLNESLSKMLNKFKCCLENSDEVKDILDYCLEVTGAHKNNYSVLAEI